MNNPIIEVAIMDLQVYKMMRMIFNDLPSAKQNELLKSESLENFLEERTNIYLRGLEIYNDGKISEAGVRELALHDAIDDLV